LKTDEYLNRKEARLIYMIKITVSSYNNEASAQTLSAIFGPKGGTIGRSEENDFVLPDPKRYVSRTQASIKNDGEHYTITNLSQASPILINGQEINFEREHVLQPGDEIKIGLYLLHTEQHVEPALADVPQHDAVLAEEIPVAEAASSDADVAPTQESLHDTHNVHEAHHATENAGLPLESALAEHAALAEPGTAEHALADQTGDITDTADASGSEESVPAVEEHDAAEADAEKVAATGQENEPEESAAASVADDQIEYTPYVELPAGPIINEFDVANAATEQQEQPDNSSVAVVEDTHSEPETGQSDTVIAQQTAAEPEPEITHRTEDPHNANVPSEITAATGAAMSAAAAVVAELHDAPAAAMVDDTPDTASAAPSQQEEVAAIAVAAAHESLPVAALEEAEAEQAPALDISPAFKPAAIPTPAETAPAPAPAPAAVANTNAADNTALIQAFLKGAGIPHITVTSGLTPEFMEMIGKLMATTVQGTFDLISSRAMMKPRSWYATIIR
jgi:predicted component of type VI protein secretion system